MIKSEEKKLKAIGKFKKELEEVKKEAVKNLEGWQRERAEFQNYKKKEEERKAEFSKITKEDLILKILNIFDNFERALRYLPDFQDEKSNNWISGIKHIHTELKKLLKEENVLEVETGKFNPGVHEAVGRKEGKKKTGLIVEVVEKGYTLNGKLIRSAKVIVSGKKKDN